MGKVKEYPLDKQEEARRNNIQITATAEDLAQVIRFHRKKGQLTQQQLAKLAGLGKAVIFDIEKGKKTVQLDTILKVLKILNVEMRFYSPLMSTFVEEHYAPGNSSISK